MVRRAIVNRFNSSRRYTYIPHDPLCVLCFFVALCKLRSSPTGTEESKAHEADERAGTGKQVSRAPCTHTH